jgi:dethiobiotin synthetase
MTRLFVTSSGTDVGKTFVMVELIAALVRAGYRPRALKPLASGFDPDRPEDSDTGRLLRAQGLPIDNVNIAAVTPWRFAAPLSPDMAARREQRRVPFDELVEFCRGPSEADVTLIEGIGGVMVPLDDRHTVLDWIRALGAPALLVVGSYLGALSHALTAAAALRARNCALLAAIVSESVVQPVECEETAVVLRRFLAPLPVHVLPRTAPGAAPRAGPDWLDVLRPILPARPG